MKYFYDTESAVERDDLSCPREQITNTTTRRVRRTPQLKIRWSVVQFLFGFLMMNRFALHQRSADLPFHDMSVLQYPPHLGTVLRGYANLAIAFLCHIRVLEPPNAPGLPRRTSTGRFHWVAINRPSRSLVMDVTPAFAPSGQPTFTNRTPWEMGGVRGSPVHIAAAA